MKAPAVSPFLSAANFAVLRAARLVMTPEEVAYAVKLAHAADSGNVQAAETLIALANSILLECRTGDEAANEGKRAKAASSKS